MEIPVLSRDGRKTPFVPLGAFSSRLIEPLVLLELFCLLPSGNLYRKLKHMLRCQNCALKLLSLILVCARAASRLQQVHGGSGAISSYLNMTAAGAIRWQSSAAVFTAAVAVLLMLAVTPASSVSLILGDR